MNFESESVLEEKSAYYSLKSKLDLVAEATGQLNSDCGMHFEGEVRDNISVILNQLMVKYWDLNVSIGNLQSSLSKLSDAILEEEKRVADNNGSTNNASVYNRYQSGDMIWGQ